MTFLGRAFGTIFAGRKARRGNRKAPSRQHGRRLAIEQMEPWMMMSVSPLESMNPIPPGSYRAPPPVVKAPNARSLTATPYSASQINVAWNSAPGATGYLIDEMIDGGDWKQIANVGISTTSIPATGLNSGTKYFFDVAAYNAAGRTWAANLKSATTGVVADHPAAPGLNYTPVSGTLFGPNGPEFTDVQQGELSDCWLLASLAEVAARDPQDIRNMFTFKGTTVENGVTVDLYNVRYYNSAGVAKYVTVDTELPTLNGSFDDPINGVLWVALAEKAYAQANAFGFVTTNEPNLNSYLALDDSRYIGDPNARGGKAIWALQAITGEKTAMATVTPANIVNIVDAWNSGDFIVLNSLPTPPSGRIVPDHSYALVSYMPFDFEHLFGNMYVLSANQTPFTLYNPWGLAAPFAMHVDSASFLEQNFNVVEVAGPAGLVNIVEAVTETVLAKNGSVNYAELRITGVMRSSGLC